MNYDLYSGAVLSGASITNGILKDRLGSKSLGADAVSEVESIIASSPRSGEDAAAVTEVNRAECTVVQGWSCLDTHALQSSSGTVPWGQ